MCAKLDTSVKFAGQFIDLYEKLIKYCLPTRVVQFRISIYPTHRTYIENVVIRYVRLVVTTRE